MQPRFRSTAEFGFWVNTRVSKCRPGRSRSAAAGKRPEAGKPPRTDENVRQPRHDLDLRPRPDCMTA
eukprot:2937713-Pyramimonas_sp.AAC.1